MNLTDSQYREAAWLNAFASGLMFCVAMEAWREATVGEHTDARQFDENVSAAIGAGEWLDRAITNYR